MAERPSPTAATGRLPTRPNAAPRPEGGPTVGIVGGGQLARMMLTAASELAIDARVLATTTDESAPGAWPHTTVAPDLDDAALGPFAIDVDVLTFDHELVDPEVLAALESHGHVLRPGARALSFSDKAHQRTTLDAAGLPVPRFAVVDDVDALVGFAASVGGWPVVVKPPRGGYDGRGVHVVDGPDAAAALLEGIGGEVVVEELVDIDAELAVLVVTRASGGHVRYPVVGTTQIDGICHEVVWPPPIAAEVAAEAERVATAVAEVVAAVGVLAVELFVSGGRVLVNEVAPRPHNSGHLTIEATTTSQFENHLRAVLDWPLGDVTPLAPAAVMLNILGDPTAGSPAPRRADALAVPGAHVHLYGKSWRAGRKLGHVTALGPDVDSARATARAALDALSGR
jgi:5-(carboxyamino)imidazole ribonucleotide synthase